MNLIKLLFKLYKTLKSVGDSGVIVIRLSKSDRKYRINRMYTEDRPVGSIYMSDGSLGIKDCQFEVSE